MTPLPDDTERKVRQWALRRNGDPLQLSDVVELVLAVDDDGTRRHAETRRQLEQLSGDVQRHCADTDARLTRLEADTRPCAIRALIEEEHGARHGEHMRADHPARRHDDPAGSEHREERQYEVPVPLPAEIRDMTRRVWVLWGVAIFVAAAIANGAISLMFHYLQ